MFRSAFVTVCRKARSDWPFVAVAIVGLALVLTNLGTDYLWADEGDTAVLASNILKSGVPKAWDGVTFTDSDFGARENQSLIMVGTPWLQYYVAAASFFLFGENTFAARLPFALAGWLTVLIGFRLLTRLTGDWKAGFSGALLLLFSVQFLLYAREARYYALSMLFTCWLVAIFFRMKSLRETVLFAAAAILLFYSHPLNVTLLAALGLLTLVYPGFSQQRRWFWLACIPISIFTVPWFFYARGGYAVMSTRAAGIGEFFARTLQYLLEVASVTSLVGTVVLVIVLLIEGRRISQPINRLDTESNSAEAVANRSNELRPILNREEIAFLVVVIVTIFSSAVVISLTQEISSLRIIGLRYTAGVIPLIAFAAGMLITKVSRGRIAVLVALMVVFALTRFDQIVPWVSWKRDGIFRIGQYSLAVHVPSSLINQFVDTSVFRFFCNLRYANPGTMGRSAAFLRRYAQPGDVVITNYESEPLYFYTRLPQGLKVLQGAPIYEAARQQNLPDYVFGVAHARWIVWRFAWDGYFGLTWSQVEQALREKGATITEMERVKETGWENRENVFFYRFCGHKHLFHSHHGHFRRTRIFRVDYPGTE